MRLWMYSDLLRKPNLTTLSQASYWKVFRIERMDVQDGVQ
jgi:hypothetical protein